MNTVLEAVQSPLPLSLVLSCVLGKILEAGNLIKQNFIDKILIKIT